MGPEASAFSLPRGYSQFLNGIFGSNVMMAEGSTHERLRDMLGDLMGPEAVRSPIHIACMHACFSTLACTQSGM
jgi:cytochrome P450